MKISNGIFILLVAGIIISMVYRPVEAVAVWAEYLSVTILTATYAVCRLLESILSVLTHKDARERRRGL